MNLASTMPLTTFWLAIAVLLFGFLLFAKAKLSVINQGRLFSFGTAKMSQANRIAYFMGYAAMCLGFFLLFSFALASHFSA